MKQLFQYYRNGELKLADVPVPGAKAGHVLVHNAASLVSVGTEKYMLELAKKSLVGKALARPDLAKQFLAKVQTDGLAEAWRQAMGRLNTPVPLGYSSAGEVVDVGRGVEGFAVGDRVGCAGSGYASHAQVVAIPANLCVKIPDNVSYDSAAFIALGGIALEAVRMARTSLGETVVVIGLGLLGQIAVQLLRAAGCHVIGMDLNPGKAKLAQEYGAEAVATDYQQLVSLCQHRTTSHGADAVIILAATPSNEPLQRSAEVCRERGRVVAAGLVGLEIPRKAFYEKELEFVVSRAWGPGVYDSAYTEKGLDYPIAHARWTAQRNMEEFLKLLDRGAVRLDYLITHRFPLEQATEAYQLILEAEQPYIGVLITYPHQPAQGGQSRVLWLRQDSGPHSGVGVKTAGGVARTRASGIGFIGAGLFARGTLLPALKAVRSQYVELRGVATATGLNARHVSDKFGFAYCTTDYHEVLNDPQVDLVFIVTQHGSHARLTTEALQAGKHVFLEKPLAIDGQQLQQVVTAYNQLRPNLQLMVGFNRRFAPTVRWLKGQVAKIGEPLAVHCTINAGTVPASHWAHDPKQGGGRIIGEVCHFVELIQYLSGSVTTRIYAESLATEGYLPSDNVVLSLKMANGGVGSITYVAGGDKRYPRERIEVFGGGSVGVINNFKSATFTNRGRTQTHGRWAKVDRGVRAEMVVLLKAVRAGGEPPVPFEHYVYTTLATFAAEESLKLGKPIGVLMTQEATV